MRKAAEVKAKAEVKQVPAGGKEPPLDTYAEFEKKAGFKIKDDLLPVFGNEIALAGSLKSLQGAGVLTSRRHRPQSLHLKQATEKMIRTRKATTRFRCCCSRSRIAKRRAG